MRARPTAIGYLRRDVSGIAQEWDEIQIRSVAKRLGYDLAKTVVFGRETDRPECRLLNVIRAVDADAVIVPSAEHFDGSIPDPLVQACDVVTVSPENTYARWPLPILGLHVDNA
ncbi:recombinase family protein [Nocardia sp. KC 131]|uniref:recombinase family protein n=1 Tax=Nocardia arseniciresistens TaxID=3392119 RepID=UPI00398E74F1